VHAVVVPATPLLAPALAGSGRGVAAAAEAVRGAARDAVAGLVSELRAAGGGAGWTVVCIGTGATTGPHPTGSWGTLAGFGVLVEAPAGHDGRPPGLPPSLTVGAWLLDRAGCPAEALVLHEVDRDASPSAALAVGRDLEGVAREGGGAVGWLVVGDGSTTRGPRAPGGHDPRGERFDAQVAAALAAGDAAALAALDPATAATVGAAGRSAWQVLAGAALLRAGSTRAAAAPLRARLLLDEAPFGVGYLVARWSPA